MLPEREVIALCGSIPRALSDSGSCIAGRLVSGGRWIFFQCKDLNRNYGRDLVAQPN
jgi:hypothetical protein